MSYENTTVPVKTTKEQIEALRPKALNLRVEENDAGTEIRVDISYLGLGGAAGSNDIVIVVPINFPAGRKKASKRAKEKKRMAAWRSAYWLSKNLIENRIIVKPAANSDIKVQILENA